MLPSASRTISHFWRHCLIFEFCSSGHLWLSSVLMLLLLTEGPSSSSPPSNSVLALQIPILSLFSAPVLFSRQPCLHIQTQSSLLWQWLTSLLQICFVLSKSKILSSTFDIYSGMVSYHLKLTMNFWFSLHKILLASSYFCHDLQPTLTVTKTSNANNFFNLF